MTALLPLASPLVLFFLWVFGKRLARMGPNHWVGIRVAAAVRSQESWERVHREGRPLVALAAAWCLLLAGLAFAPTRFGLATALVLQGLVLVWLTVTAARMAGGPDVRGKGLLGELLNEKQIRALLLILFALFFVMTLSLPLVAKTGPNAWIGIRVGKRMADPEVWRQVHLAAMWPSFLGSLSFLLAWFGLREGWADGWAYRSAWWLAVVGPLVAVGVPWDLLALLGD